METISLILLVFVLGLRHGLDADHLACIDGLTRYNGRLNSSIARWVGLLFSFGHGLVVTIIAAILGIFMKSFTIPDLVNTLVTWFSTLSLFAIGTLNLFNLLRKKSTENEDFRVSGIKGKFLPKMLKETTNPFFVILIGGLFALAAETVSQTSMWAIAAGNTASYMPVLLGIIFMLGMMITDTLDSIVAFRLLKESNRLGQSASRVMGWVIVVLAYGVSFYQAFTFFFPWAELDYEILGVMLFTAFVLSYLFISYRIKKQMEITLKN
ncbi:sodium:proton antiporter [Bacillus sp. ISL-40]|uniref:HoxN/HupN/NixA family nickel/cobalt transporter n=1 Tax=unclassified Bacillus (in: firmicutes) TaxID=185979 RepID=UPI001BEA3380|nr:MULTISPECIES: sodium:proton antiporter [unclassified Bacillus (in: firmicutes)]MBT2698512.1 sodium:proton antiporter [Bacillus sp. ISL-40]MBT2720145.1 sodium:proton antiporter [Bacillus sp. ISL-46]MBT2739262.1 sodium:proton antiporter [Bacillus sp. ISL-77]